MKHTSEKNNDHPGYRPTQTNGKFQVTYLHKAVDFDVYEEALKFFLNITGEATLWDITDHPYAIKVKSH